MRAIDADTLVNRIVFHTDIPSEYKEQVEDTISDMQTIETEPRWIPCSERLPEDSGEYLTFQCSANIKYGWYQVLCYDDGWNCFGSNKKNEVKYVVAWMPLPKPWGGSGEND